MKITTLSSKHKIYRALDVLSEFDNQLIFDEFNNNEWIFKKIESKEDKLSYPIRGSLNSKRLGRDSLNIIGHNLQFIKFATEVKYKLQSLVIENPLVLFRINTNIQFFGMESSFHRDNPNEEKNYWTFVYFIGPNWDVTYAGEFCVHTGGLDYHYVPYIPNTGVLFPAHLEHMGHSPNRLSNRPRLSIAFTYQEQKNSGHSHGK